MRKLFCADPFPHELFVPKGRGPFPLIVITPLLGRVVFLDDLFFERHFAHFFARNGYASAVIHRPIFEFDTRFGLEQIPHYLEETLQRNDRILEALLKRNEINPAKLGTFGMSFGAIANCLWAARDPRFKAHVMAVPGGDLPGIFVTSRDPMMRSFLKAALHHSGLNIPQLEAALAEKFKTDPLKTAPVIGRGKVLLLLAVFDRVIRFHYGLKLRQALGKPETIFLPLGHYITLLTVPVMRYVALNFFKRKIPALPI